MLSWIHTCLVPLPPKIRDWELCDAALENCGEGGKKEQDNFLTVLTVNNMKLSMSHATNEQHLRYKIR